MWVASSVHGGSENELLQRNHLMLQLQRVQAIIARLCKSISELPVYNYNEFLLLESKSAADSDDNVCSNIS